jgi:tartrate/fumarate subfamily iron-sulfur-dependent hydro-lyase beta chain
MRKLEIGDVVYLNGRKVFIVSTSGATYLFKSIEKNEPFFDLDGSVIYHSSLSLSKEGRVRWVGSTTSIMCEPETPRLIELGAHVIMGKGGMGKGTLNAMKRFGAVYLATVGGTSAVLTRGVTRVIKIVDTPVRLAEIELKDFGPVIVGMDAKGRSLYDDLYERAKRKSIELADARIESRLYGRYY